MLEKPNIMFKHIKNENGKLTLKGTSISFVPAPTNNCKLSIWEYPGSIYGVAKTHKLNDADIAEVYKEVLTLAAVPVIFIHITDPIFAKFVLEHLTVVYYTEVPIGYGARIQYHILLFANPEATAIYTNSKVYFDRIKKEGITIKSDYAKTNESKKDNSDIKKLVKALKEVLDLKYSRISVLKANIKKVLGQSAGID